MTAIPASTRTSGLHGASMVLLGVAGAVVLVDAVVSVQAGAPARGPWAFATLLAALIGMVAAGAVLVRDRRHAGLGRLLLGIAAAGGLLDLTTTLRAVGPDEFLSGFVSALYVALIIHLLVRWPDSRVSGSVPRALVAAAYVVPMVLTAIWHLTWDPRWFEGDERNRWWVTLVPARNLSAGVFQAEQIILAALVAALLVVVIIRAATARGPRLAALAPVAAIAVVLAATDVVSIAVLLGAPIDLDLEVVQDLALLAVPVAVLVAVVREPAEVDAPVAPGRRGRLDEIRDRYRLGLAGIAAGVVVVVAFGVGVSSGAEPDAPSTPAPGPALVAP